jgi:hypothetical protein
MLPREPRPKADARHIGGSGALNRCEEWPRSVIASALAPRARHGSDHWCRRGVARSHQSMASAPAVMRSRRPAMNSAWVPRRGRSRTSRVRGGPVVVLDRLIHGVGVDLAGAVAVDRCLDVAEQFGQLRLVVGADPFTRGAPFSFRAHDGTLLCSSQTGRGPGLTSRPWYRRADQPVAPYRRLYVGWRLSRSPWGGAHVGRF